MTFESFVAARALLRDITRRRGRPARAPAPADTRVPAPAPVPGPTPEKRPPSPHERPAPAPGFTCSLCGWHQVRCGQCGRQVAIRERCPAHEEAPR